MERVRGTSAACETEADGLQAGARIAVAMAGRNFRNLISHTHNPEIPSVYTHQSRLLRSPVVIEECKQMFIHPCGHDTGVPAAEVKVKVEVKVDKRSLALWHSGPLALLIIQNQSHKPRGWP